MSHSERFANPFSLNAVAARSARQNAPEGPRTDSEQPLWWSAVSSPRAASSSWISPSPPSDGGEGWGEEVRFYWFPLSSVLSPLVPRGEDGELDAALCP